MGDKPKKINGIEIYYDPSEFDSNGMPLNEIPIIPNEFKMNYASPREVSYTAELPEIPVTGKKQPYDLQAEYDVKIGKKQPYSIGKSPEELQLQQYNKDIVRAVEDFTPLYSQVKQSVKGFKQGSEQISSGSASGIVAGLLKSGFSVAGLTNPTVGLFNLGVGQTTPYAPKVSEYAFSPVTKLINPKTQEGKNVAEIGDFLTQALVLGGMGRGIKTIRGKTEIFSPEINTESLAEKPSLDLEKGKIDVSKQTEDLLSLEELKQEINTKPEVITEPKKTPEVKEIIPPTEQVKTPVQLFAEGKELIGTAEITPEGNLKGEFRRFSETEFGDKSRGGTWYEIPAYEGARSSYQSGWWGSREANFGVGGKNEFKRNVELKNPYFYDWSNQGEAKSPLRLGNKILGIEETKRLSKGIFGAKNPESAYAKLENAISKKLSEQGYDGLVFYDKMGNMVHPKQAFVFDKKVPTTPLKSEVATSDVSQRGSFAKSTEQVKVETPLIGQTNLKTTKLANDINSRLVEQGFEKLPPEELAQYNSTTKKALVDKVTEVMKDPENAKTQLFDKNSNLTPRERQVLANVLEEKALAENDYITLKKLSLSDVPTERSEAAGVLGASAYENVGEFSPVKAMQDVIKAREESPAGKRREIISKGYEDKIKSLEDKISKQDERIKKIELDKAYKKIQREESATTRREKRQVTKENLKKDFSSVMDEFVKSYKPNIAIDPAQVKVLLKAVRIKAQEGITDAAQVLDDIYVVLADKIDGITREDIRDAISGYGKTILKTRDELTKQIADLKKQMELMAKIEDLQKGELPDKKVINKTKPSKELQALQNQLKEELAKSDIVIEDNLNKTKETVRKKIKEIEDNVNRGKYTRPEIKEKPTDENLTGLQKELKDVRDRWNDIQKNLGEKITDEEAKTISELSKAVKDAKEIKDVSTRREVGKPQTTEEKAYGDAYTTYTEYIDVLKEDANKITWKEFKAIPLGEKLGLIGKKALTLPGMSKSLKATFDNSGLFNQNILTLFTHPMIWQRNARKSFQDIWNVLGGENVMKEINSDKVSRPNYDNGIYKKLKLAIGAVEEAFPESKALENIPLSTPSTIPLGTIHKAANTAYTGLAYRNRMDIADLLVEHSKNIGMFDKFLYNKKHPKDIEGLGKVINSLTGRASLGRVEGGADILNAFMFAPRFLKSHFDVLLAHVYSKDMGRFARIEALKDLIKIVGGMTATTVAINAVRPGTIETDPHSTDFAKIKIGDTRFNYTGGLGQAVVFSTRVLPLLMPNGKSYTKNTKGELVELNSGKYGAKTGYNILTDFMRGKTSPFSGYFLNRLDGKTYTGKRLTIANQLGGLITPLPIENFVETKQDPKSADLLFTVMADFVGLFATTYSSDENLQKINNDLLTADKEKFYGEKLSGFNLALSNALESGVITKEQYITFEQLFEELQQEAPDKIPEENQ